MKLHRAFLAASLTFSLAAPATTIPADLEARAAELRKQASPQTLAWAHDKGVALARVREPIDVGALEQTIRLQFVKRNVHTQKTVASSGRTYPNLGSMGDGDIMALCFIVMMEAAKSAQEDLKAIMDGVKAINKQKDGLREVQSSVNARSATKTPTPAPDRAAQLVTAARSIVGKTRDANLAMMTAR